MSEEPAKVVPWRSPRAAEEQTEFLAMVVFQCAWAMLFCGLLLAYGVIRSTSKPWLPAGAMPLPRFLGGIWTAGMLTLSALVHIALRALRANARVRAVEATLGAIVLAGCFMATQLGFARSLRATGVTFSGSPYGSVAYLFTFFHALHALVGIGALVWMVPRIARGLYSAARVQPLRLWSIYFHGVTAAWVLTYVLVYLP